jgi:hypothetical protein
MSKRRIRLLLITAGILGAIALSMSPLLRLLERKALERSELMVRELSGPGSMPRIGKVEIDLLKGDILWHDLRIDQPPDVHDGRDAHSLHLSGRVENVSVRGISLWRLLMSNTLSVRSITIDHPDLDIQISNDTSATPQASGEEGNVTGFNADSLLLKGFKYRSHRVADSSQIVLDSMDLQLLGVRSRWSHNSPLDLRFVEVVGQLRGIHATLPPLYDLRIAQIELRDNGRNLLITGAAFRPLKSKEEYDRVVHFETDLIDAQVDTALVQGLDLLQLIRERVVKADSLHVSGVALDVARDKTMPDEPYRVKRLPARLVRDIPVKLCLERVVLDRVNVAYHEKGSLSPEFGDVTFTDIHSVITGLCTTDTLRKDTLLVVATAKGYDKANIRLQVRTVIFDPSDRFQVNALVSGLPFRVFNQMTADLILVRATAGTIGGVDLTMTADNDRAVGRVDMEYDKLSVEMLKQDGSGKKNKFKSTLMNMAVHDHNLRSDPSFRHGDFTIQRQKDRSIFNYLWSGMREGMIMTVLPDVVKEIRKVSSKPAAAR